ncbi:E3 ubiquitin-protein ligase RZFP34, variant 4 [Lathyrus oleraceus]|uniref:E3 ubiquitin-protein ligase RZFP34, variant 4 n=1 Tax=Pisum sativum TaxID=3888 RepID=A0A9D4XSL3_PEA|nr:E3 ubiquitin-protein ligase RZFP34, variant 4 [Pisum sativum]
MEPHNHHLHVDVDVSSSEIGSEHYGSSVPCVAQSKMFNKFAFNAVFAWVDTSAPNASSLMTMYRRNNTIVMNVAYAELEAKRTFSTVTNVVSFSFNITC